MASIILFIDLHNLKILPVCGSGCLEWNSLFLLVDFKRLTVVHLGLVPGGSRY